MYRLTGRKTPSCLLTAPCPFSRYKGSREIHDCDKYEITSEGDKQILVIRNVYGEDADEYSVRASNKGGSRISRAELDISCEWNVLV